VATAKVTGELEKLFPARLFYFDRIVLQQLPESVLF
jgi:hypothetical protein